MSASDWICIGEVEESSERGTCFETDHDEWYLFKRKDKVCDDTIWVWTIAPSARVADSFDPFWIDMDISALTFLVAFISADREFGRLNGGVLGRKCDGFKIRLVGMTEWLTVDDDYLHNRISLLDLENKFRKHKLTREMLGNN